MKRPLLLLFAFTLILNNFICAQEVTQKKASTLGKVMTVDNKADFSFFGNWEVIDTISDAQEIDLMPNQSGPTGKYLFLKPTHERSAISSYIEDGYHSVDLGFYVYKKKHKCYGNLDASVAVMFEEQYKGHLIAFECKYIKDKDQLKLTTSNGIVFYLKRME